MKNSNEELVKVTVRVPKYKKEMIQKTLIKSPYNNMSALINAGIDKELSIQIYKENLDFIIKEMARAIESKLKPFTEAQRKFMAKILRTNAINTYLSGEILENIFGDEGKQRFKKMLQQARKKANYYINKDTEGMSKLDLYDFYNIGEIYRDE